MRLKKEEEGLVVIGVDPAFRKNGFAVCFWDLSDNTMNFEMYGDVLEFHNFINSEDAPEKAVCIIENSNLQNTTFDLRGNKLEVAKKSRNVGTNQAVSQLTVWSCEGRYGAENTYGISPKQKGAKLKGDFFNTILNKYKIRTHVKRMNQDMRDAGQLALKYVGYRKQIVKRPNSKR